MEILYFFIGLISLILVTYIISSIDIYYINKEAAKEHAIAMKRFREVGIEHAKDYEITKRRMSDAIYKRTTRRNIRKP